MEMDKVAVMVVDEMADMVVDEMANMEVDKVADMVVYEWTALNLFSNPYLRKISLPSMLS